MREYALQIGERYFDSISTRSPLHLEFEVCSFSGEGAAVPGFIRLFNLDEEAFNYFVSKPQLPFVLQAGWRTSPFISKLGYTSIGLYTLCVGHVETTLGDFAGTSPYLTFFYKVNSVATKAANDANRDNLQNVATIENTINRNPQQESKCNIKIPPKSVMEKFLVKGVQTFTDYLVKPHKLLGQMINSSDQSIALVAKTLGELLLKYKTDFNVLYEVRTDSKCIMLYPAGADTMSEKVNEEINNLGKKLPEDKRIIVLTAEDLLAQPEVVDAASKQVHVLARLRTDMRIGDIMVLNGRLPSMQQIAAGYGSNGTSVMPSSVNMKSLFQLGAYTITKITHKGEFYNPAAEAWSTSILGTPAFTW